MGVGCLFPRELAYLWRGWIPYSIPPSTRLSTRSRIPSHVCHIRAADYLYVSIMKSIVLFLVGIVVFICFQNVYNRYFHPLSKFPGPFWASQTDVWKTYHLCTKRLPNTFTLLHRRYGPVVRIGPNDISFESVDAIDPIYKSGRRVVKSSFYDGFTTFHPNLFGTRDEEVSLVSLNISLVN